MSESLKRAKKFMKELQDLCKQYKITIGIDPKNDFFFTDETNGRIWTTEQLRSDNILEKVKNWVE